MADTPWPGDIANAIQEGTRFLLQIVDVDPPHHVARFPAGGPLERAFIEHCTAEIMRRGVGLMKTEAHVRADIRTGLEAAILALKMETLHLPKR